MHHTGLSPDQVTQIRLTYGENALPEKQEHTSLKILLEQLKSPLIWLLIATSLISLLFNQYSDAGLIFAVLVVDVVIGYYQENKAHGTLQALKKIINPMALVIRNSERIQVSTRELVPEDLVVLGPGDVVPADGELLESVNLLVKEAILTGEQEAVEKSAIGDKKVYMGTSVLTGSAVIKVTLTGGNTEFGKIGQDLSGLEETETPLQKSLEKFSQQLTIAVIGICILIFITGLFRQKDVWEMLRFAIVLSIAAIPEGLPIVVTVILSLGMKRILERKGLVKNLLSVETLGSTTVICTDKTGTLTEGNMQVVAEEFTEKQHAYEALLINNEQRTNMEVALWDYAHAHDFDTAEFLNTTEKEFVEPFSSETKYYLTVCKTSSGKVAYLTGAPEVLMSFCTLTEGEIGKEMDKIEEWAEKGLRVMAIAFKEHGDLQQRQGFTWLGVIGIDDPIRKGAKDSLMEARNAGIKVKIITGDYRKTAEKIAATLGLQITSDEIMEGSELEEISEEELAKKIGKIKLFARVSPQHKLKIVNALQANGEVVAMTGDGVNDVLALKKADIGIAMGNAVEVAKEAADLILLDNNFQTIVETCEEGRLVFMNIKKVIGYILSNSFAEVSLIFGSMLFNLPVPLTVAQILWVHLICDGPPDIILGFDHNKEGLLDEPPKNHLKESILDNKIKALIAFVSGSIALVSVGLFWVFNYQLHDLSMARSMIFALLCIISLVYIFSYKDLNKPLFRIRNFFDNKLLLPAVLYGVILTLIAIYVPFFNQMLGTRPLDLADWALILLAATGITLGVEAIKALKVWKK